MRYFYTGILASLVGCVEVETASPAYSDGCDDGWDVGKANGLVQGESCGFYDADPGKLSTGTDEYAVSYDEGYLACYPDGYAEGYEEGSIASACYDTAR